MIYILLIAAASFSLHVTVRLSIYFFEKSIDSPFLMSVVFVVFILLVNIEFRLLIYNLEPVVNYVIDIFS